MPIRKELRRKFYGREWRKVIRPRILARAEDRCEHCGKPNGATVFTRSGRNGGHYWMHWKPEAGHYWLRPWCVHSASYVGERTINRWGQENTQRNYEHKIRVVVTIAHLNHTPGDDRDENLAALCQWCHLMHDKDHHRDSRADRKDAARPLLTL